MSDVDEWKLVGFRMRYALENIATAMNQFANAMRDAEDREREARRIRRKAAKQAMAGLDAEYQAWRAEQETGRD